MIVTAVAVGTRGDINPLAELGEEMIRRGHEFRILTSEAFRSLIESKGIKYIKLDTDADHVMKYLVTDYKTSLDFAKGMFRLKKENPEFMKQTLNAIKESDLVMYGTCAAFEALKRTGIRAIVQAFQIPEKDRINTDKLFFIDTVPYPYIFERVRAVVHHGGNTTNGMGLRAGLPTLVIALALDQYFYGRMDNRVGCGPKPLYIRKKLCSAEEIAESLKDLVSGRYDLKAQEISQKIREENGVVTAAEEIEKYISEKINE